MGRSYEPIGKEGSFGHAYSLPDALRGTLHEAVHRFDLLLCADISSRDHTLQYHDGVVYRSFRYRGDAPSVLGGEAIEDRVEIYHSTLPAHGDSYGMRTSWKVAGAPERERFENDYLLEMYPDGPAYATIWQSEVDVLGLGSLGTIVRERQMQRGDFISLNEDFRRLLAVVATGIQS